MELITFILGLYVGYMVGCVVMVEKFKEELKEQRRTSHE